MRHSLCMGEILQLLFPERCVGCSRSAGLLCARCSREWGKSISNTIHGVPLISSAYYSQQVAQIVLRAKENNDSRARRILANAIANHIQKPQLILPIPSSALNTRRRGFDHSLLLAQEVARLTGSTVWSGLVVNRRIKDQTRLSHAKRFINLSGSYSLKEGNVSNFPVVLIDDLVTTGASMKEAIRVLHSEKGSESRTIRAISACIASHHLPNTISP